MRFDACSSEWGGGRPSPIDRMTSATGGLPPRNRRQLMMSRPVGGVMAGRIAAIHAFWIGNIASALLMFELTRSALLVGMVTFAQFVPQIVLAPYCGVRADRSDRFLQLVVGAVVAAAGPLIVVVVALLVPDSTDALVGALLVGSATVGVGFAVGGPAFQAILPALVEPQELLQAVALSSLPAVLARAIGPAVGVFVVTFFGTVAVFAVATSLFVVYLALLLLDTSRIRGRSGVSRAGSRDASLRSGLEYVRSRRALRLMLLAITAVGVGIDPVVTLTPSLADVAGFAPSKIGEWATLFGIGSVVGYGLATRVQTKIGSAQAGVIGLTLILIGLLGVLTAGLPGSVRVASLSFALLGVGFSLAVSAYTYLIQGSVDDESRGRIMSFWSVAFLGSRPLAALVSGSVADVFGVQMALLFTAAIIGVVILVCQPQRILAG